MFSASLFSLVALATFAAATPLEGRAASCTFPSPPSTSSLSKAMTISGSFDGKNVRYDRGSGACEGQTEGGDADAVFLLNDGATLSNVVIGANQAEGIHCLGACTLNNVWFEDVCEDAITIKQTSSSAVSKINGGGAKHAEDKVVQHNGAGTVQITNFCVQDFGKLYRSCGNCSKMYKRSVTMSNINASSGGTLAGINSNYGDTAVITSSSVVTSDVDSICDTYQGNDSGDEPKKLTSNQKNSYCQF